MIHLGLGKCEGDECGIEAADQMAPSVSECNEQGHAVHG